jgi:uncharacterized membrane protein
MLYISLKLLHVAALTLWLLGMLLASVACFPSSEAQAPGRFVLGVARWNTWVTTPAMLLTWLCGLLLASMAGWFGQNWLTVKIVLVLALSGLQGMHSAGLRRLCAGKRVPGVLAASSVAITLAVLVIVALATVKPEL